jgi:hypothetical protein
MKKRLILFSALISMCLVIFSQTMFEYDLKIEKHVKDGVTSATIEITLKKGETPVKYSIINGTTLKDDILVESEFTNETDYKFNDIPAGKYLIKIEDEQGRIAGKYFEISE